MANKVKLKTLVEKMNLKNLTPDSLNILIPNVCRS